MKLIGQKGDRAVYEPQLDAGHFTLSAEEDTVLVSNFLNVIPVENQGASPKGSQQASIGIHSTSLAQKDLKILSFLNINNH